MGCAPGLAGPARVSCRSESNLWIASDNARKAPALIAGQLAELLIKDFVSKILAAQYAPLFELAGTGLVVMLNGESPFGDQAASEKTLVFREKR
jgi:hypothetical protein